MQYFSINTHISAVSNLKKSATRLRTRDCSVLVALRPTEISIATFKWLMRSRCCFSKRSSQSFCGSRGGKPRSKLYLRPSRTSTFVSTFTAMTANDLVEEHHPVRPRRFLARYVPHITRSTKLCGACLRKPGFLQRARLGSPAIAAFITATRSRPVRGVSADCLCRSASR